MRTIIARPALLAIASTFLLGGCMPGLMMGRSDGTLIRTASFDNDCPAERIKIVSKDEGLGSGQYVLDVCGTEIKYKRSGTVYYRADRPLPGQD